METLQRPLAFLPRAEPSAEPGVARREPSAVRGAR